MSSELGSGAKSFATWCLSPMVSSFEGELGQLLLGSALGLQLPKKIGYWGT